MLSIWSTTISNLVPLANKLTGSTKENSSKDQYVFVENDNKYFFTLPVYYNHRLINTTMDMWKFQMNRVEDSTNEILKGFLLNNEGYGVYRIDAFLSTLLFTTSDDTYNPEIVQIEEFACIYDSYSTQRKNYTIRFVSKKDHLRRVVTLKDKIICAKYLIMMMNEINYEDVNMANYCRLVKWLNDTANNYLGDGNKEIYPKGW